MITRSYPSRFIVRIACAAVGLLLSLGVRPSSASSFTFYGTDTPSAWSVAVNQNGPFNPYSAACGGPTDAQAVGCFPTTGFATAVAVTGRPDYIANVPTGTNETCGGIACDFVYFAFQETFDLTGLDPATADLQFQWAADDIGDGDGLRGAWPPKFSLNGGTLGNGGVPVDYAYGGTVDINSGFVSGLNTITFYVEGNGVTDGMELKVISATADPAGAAATVPEPGTLVLIGSGVSTLVARRFRRV